VDNGRHNMHGGGRVRHGHHTDTGNQMNTKRRLTDKLVRELPAPASGAVITYDSDAPGFGVRVTAGGARAYIVRYRIAGVGERRYTIGDARQWKAAAARARANDVRAGARIGIDPLAELEQARSEPTVGDLCDRFIEEFLDRKRPSTRKSYRASIEGTKRTKGIRQHFCHTKVAQLTSAEVEAFHRLISRTAPILANRSLAVLSRMLNLSVKWGWRETNPCRGADLRRRGLGV
jgi:hypothetical protein